MVCVANLNVIFFILLYAFLVSAFSTAPKGRSTNLDDIIFRFYGTNSTSPTSYKVGDIKNLLSDLNFDIKRRTVFYAHGYVELISDESVMALVKAYLTYGGYNIVVVDWANLAFGNYLNVALDVNAVGKETGRGILQLLRQGLPLQGLHFVGHSLGVHVLSAAARTLAKDGFRVPRLTGLDPAFPGFYPSILGQSTSSSDADFVDIIHTDAGGFGAPVSTGHADFWPNGGRAKQPGCSIVALPLSNQDFCSHWRSWVFWAESVEGGMFLARQCANYGAFLADECRDNPIANMGIAASPDLRGDFYLRTASQSPHALGKRGADSRT